MMGVMTDALRARAEQLGILTSHHDVDGVLHHADDTTIAHVVAVLEADRASVGSTTRLTAPLHLLRAGPVTIDARVGEASLTVEPSRVR